MHERLGVSQDASFDDIGKAYRIKALMWHPDRNPGRAREAHFEFIAVNEAFKELYVERKYATKGESAMREPKYKDPYYDFFNETRGSGAWY